MTNFGNKNNKPGEKFLKDQIGCRVLPIAVKLI
jgi:hypothetical protein